jgi:hypothetical protein
MYAYRAKLEAEWLREQKEAEDRFRKDPQVRIKYTTRQRKRVGAIVGHSPESVDSKQINAGKSRPCLTVFINTVLEDWGQIH